MMLRVNSSKLIGESRSSESAAALIAVKIAPASASDSTPVLIIKSRWLSRTYLMKPSESMSEQRKAFLTTARSSLLKV